MAHVPLPHMGVSVTEATLSTWLKQVGDRVEVGEAICEVSTDKVDTEIESTVAGVLTHQHVGVEEVVQVGEPLATVASADDAEADDESPTADPSAPATSGAREPEPAVEDPPSEPASEPAADQPAAASAPSDDEVVLLPRMGVSVTEATVSAWLKQVGDGVEVGEAICEVSTDKVDTEIESTVSGILAEQRYADGETVQVGEALAVITADGTVPTADATETREPAAADAAPAVVSHQPDAPAEVAAPRRAAPGAPAELRPGPFDHEAAVKRVLGGVGRTGRPAASPAARRLATELGVDLGAVTGTGGAGHVTRGDVQKHADTSPPAPSRSVDAAPTTPAAGRPAPAPAEAGPGSLPVGYEDVPYEEVATSRIRRVTAEHMTRSRRTAAHMTTEVDVDLGRLTDVRARLNNQRLSRGESKLSFLPFIARATCAALVDHPDLNATFETERLLRWSEVNLGVAVDTPKGLMVPVLRGAQEMTVESLGRGIAELAERIRTGKPGADDFRAGTFTISNPGSVGAVSAPAIINQPQVAILGMPTIVRKPWVVTLPDGQETIAIRPILRLAMTFDHRAVDGADATRCLVDIRRRLEAWDVDSYR